MNRIWIQEKLICWDLLSVEQSFARVSHSEIAGTKVLLQLSAIFCWDKVTCILQWILHWVIVDCPGMQKLSWDDWYHQDLHDALPHAFSGRKRAAKWREGRYKKQCPYGILSNEDMLTVLLTVSLRITGSVSTAQLTLHSLVFGWGQVLHGSDQRPGIDEHHNQCRSSMAWSKLISRKLGLRSLKPVW